MIETKEEVDGVDRDNMCSHVDKNTRAHNTFSVFEFL